MPKAGIIQGAITDAPYKWMRQFSKPNGLGFAFQALAKSHRDLRKMPGPDGTRGIRRKPYFASGDFPDWFRKGSRPTLYRWARRLDPAVGRPPTEAEFAELVVRAPQATVSSSRLEVVLACGRVIRVHGAVDVAQLRAVLETLGS